MYCITLLILETLGSLSSKHRQLVTPVAAAMSSTSMVYVPMPPRVVAACCSREVARRDTRGGNLPLLWSPTPTARTCIELCLSPSCLSRMLANPAPAMHVAHWCSRSCRSRHSGPFRASTSRTSSKSRTRYWLGRGASAHRAYPSNTVAPLMGGLSECQVVTRPLGRRCTNEWTNVA